MSKVENYQLKENRDGSIEIFFFGGSTMYFKNWDEYGKWCKSISKEDKIYAEG